MATFAREPKIPPARNTRRWATFGVAGALLAIGLLVAFLTLSSRASSDRYNVPALDRMSADEVADAFFHVAPELLAVVYRAFGETDEAAIYDSLAEVAAGDALEALYLERVGAMAGGGLDPSDGANQEIHAMEMLRIDSSRRDQTFTWNARWRVVGTVGHATHMHVRGNVYAAVLTVEPVEGAWRITGFELTDVDRSEAGQIVLADP